MILINTILLICCTFMACSSTTKTDDNIYELEIVEETTAEQNLLQYPIVLTPSHTTNIEFAIESEDIICIYNGETYGYIKKNGEEITDYVYDVAYPFSEGCACVAKDKKYGFLDNNGKEVIPFKYTDAAPFSEGLAYFCTEEEYGFMNPDGTVAFYLDCDSVSSFQEGMAYYSIDGKYGYIDKDGQTVLEPTYNDADYFLKGLAFVDKNGYKGAINQNGEEIIPIQYDSIVRNDEYIAAVIGEGEPDYYNLNGEPISNPIYSENQECIYHIEENDEGEVVVYNQSNQEILSVKCDFATKDLYCDDTNYILHQYDGEDSILFLQENATQNLADILLKNSITPRIKKYWNVINGNTVEAINPNQEMVDTHRFFAWSNYEYIKKAKLYDIKNTGSAILYCMEEPAIFDVFPMSDSALYMIENNQLYILAEGNECGGSLRGDYVCFWREQESGKILPGINGAAGGFGGFSEYSTIYDYTTKGVQQLFSYEHVWQTPTNYDAEILIENAHLFYDENKNPYTKETIQNAETVYEYLINDENVLWEEYITAKQKYQMIELL